MAYETEHWISLCDLELRIDRVPGYFDFPASPTQVPERTTDEIVTKSCQRNDPGGQRKHPNQCGNADLDGAAVITFRAAG